MKEQRVNDILKRIGIIPSRIEEFKNDNSSMSQNVMKAIEETEKEIMGQIDERIGILEWKRKTTGNVVFKSNCVWIKGELENLKKQLKNL